MQKTTRQSGCCRKGNMDEGEKAMNAELRELTDAELDGRSGGTSAMIQAVANVILSMAPPPPSGPPNWHGSELRHALGKD